MPKRSYPMFLTAFNGITAVALGALGAHALQTRLAARGTLEAWKTASHYQLTHAAASLAVLAWAAAQPERGSRLHRVSLLWQIGGLLFSGSIYCLSLGGPRLLGPVTPLGGVAFLAGWILVAWEGLRSSRPSS